MKKRLIAFLLFYFFKNLLSFNAARTVDPLALAFEQILSDITFEIVPCPTYPNAGPTYSNYYDGPNQYGSYNPNIYSQYSNVYEVPNQYEDYRCICPTCSNYYDVPNQYGGYNPNICGNPYDQSWMDYGSSVYTSPYDQYGMYGYEYGPNIYGSVPYDQYGMSGWDYNPNICSNPVPYDQYGMSGWDYNPNICSSPMTYDQCIFDSYPSCNCYRDIKNPSVYEDSSSIYLCFDNYGYGGNKQPSPYVYFPEVEYPMSAMEVRPYYYGSSWCS